MKTYKTTVYMTEEQFDRVNRLLDIDSLAEMTDQELLDAGANTDQCESIFVAKFEDGSILNYDLCSGQTNYYDDVWWTSPDGSRDIFLECAFGLSNIEFGVDGDQYIVAIELE